MASERLTVALERPDLSTARSVTTKWPFVRKRGAGVHMRLAVTQLRVVTANFLA